MSSATTDYLDIVATRPDTNFDQDDGNLRSPTVVTEYKKFVESGADGMKKGIRVRTLRYSHS